ncbi:DNA ligase [soil metagenome]
MNILRRNLLVTLAAAVPATCLLARPSASANHALLLANVYREAIDPAGYLVSEKLDGVRGVWDGQSLRFRSGRPVPAPAWFTGMLPREPLDGELWLGRGRFDALSGIVRTSPANDEDWRQVRYMVFELPGAAGRFDERAQRLRELVARTGWSQLQAVDQAPVADRATLQRRLAQTVAQGGEGLVLHLASSEYTTGRGDAMLKLKPTLDTEATVIGHEPGQGKYAGQLGALKVEAADGRRFFVGTGMNDEMRRNPPPVGTVITYRYRDLTPSGLPRFASFLRLHDAL